MATAAPPPAPPHPKQQLKPILSSFEAAMSSSSTYSGTAAAGAPQQQRGQQANATAAAAAAAGSNPFSPRLGRLSARPTSGYEGTLSAGPSELAGYANEISGGGRGEGAIQEEEQAADPERATAEAAGAAANGNNANAPSFSPPSSPRPCDHRHGAASVSTTIVTLLSLQLGWGLWLLPADFAMLGWVGAGVTISAVAALTAYSASLFPRLVAAVEGAVLFGDVGEAAAGKRGRAAVYAIIYTLDASR